MYRVIQKSACLVAASLVGLVNGYLDQNGKVIIPGASSYNGLNLVPQMGWNTWNHFGCDISEDTIMSAAQAIVNYNLTQLQTLIS